MTAVLPWVLWATMYASGVTISQHSEQFENKKACEDAGRAVLAQAAELSKGALSVSVRATFSCRTRNGQPQ